MPYCHPDAPNDTCPICQRYLVDAEFRAIIDKVPPFMQRTGVDVGQKVAHSPKQPQCIHLGPVVERSVGQCAQKCRYQCEAGRGLVRPAYECKECKAEPGSPYEADDPTAEPEVKVPSMPRETLPPILKRNLLFHLYPVPTAWQWHAHRLVPRLPLFNGRRIIAIATGSNLDHPDTVRTAFPGCEFIEVPNDPRLREVTTFEPLFRQIPYGPNEATFYGHSKGVSRQPHETSRRWTEVLYETSLDHWPHVEKVLDTYPIAGSLLKVGRGWKPAESESEWHYSGSFWWFRNQPLLSKPDWNRIDQFWCGIESYLSLHFPLSDAGELFHRAKVGDLHPYKWDYWHKVIEPALSVWQRLHGDERTGVLA